LKSINPNYPTAASFSFAGRRIIQRSRSRETSGTAFPEFSRILLRKLEEENAMSMLPQPGRPESEENEAQHYPDSQPGYYPDIQRPRRKFTTKTKILIYAVVAGTVLAIFFSFVNTIFILWSNPIRDFFADRDFAGPPIFFPTFVRLFGAYAPFFIVAAALAAAAEHMIRRASANASQNSRARVDALRELSERNLAASRVDRPELVDPMKNLNLEIEPGGKTRE
jgi:hypothetical protein